MNFANYDYKKAMDERDFNYQKERDAIADSQWQKEYDLSLQSLNKSRSSGGSSSRSSGSGQTLTFSGNDTETPEVQTPYYVGSLNSDANTYGTFSNGYQPKGISGYGTLSKTGDTLTFNTNTLAGENKTVQQNIWKTEDGSKWYWDGRYNKYIKI